MNTSHTLKNKIIFSLLFTLCIVSIQFAYAEPEFSFEFGTTGTGEDEFDNHCAINVSDALYKCDIKLKSFTGAKCWHKCSSSKNIHAIRAQELADWLKRQPFAGCPKPIKLTGATYVDAIEEAKSSIALYVGDQFAFYEKGRADKNIDSPLNDFELNGVGALPLVPGSGDKIFEEFYAKYFP